MKLTDFCIVFGAILIGLFFYNDLKIKAINETQISQMMLNINMDEIVVDGLYAGFMGIDENGNKKVDLTAVSNHMFEEMSILFFGKNDMGNMVQKYVSGMIYIDVDGFYLYESGEWVEKCMFPKGISHSEKIELISVIIDEMVEDAPLIAYNDGESYKNTIDDNTLIIVYCGYNFMTSEFVYKNSFISAATIKHNQ